MEKKEQKIAVIGAGIAGLVAAYELQKKGFDVYVYEKEDHPGGRMRTDKKDGWTFDSGADFLNDNYRTLKAYADELGVLWQPTLPEGLHRVIRGGVGYPLVLQSPADIFKMKFLSPRARIAFLFWAMRLKLGRQLPSFYYLSPVKTGLSNENAYDYLTEHVHPDVAIYVADAFTSIMQFHRAKEISADALHALVQMMVSPHERFAVRYTPDGITEIARQMAARLTVHYSSPLEMLPTGFDAWVIATTTDASAGLTTGPTRDFLNTVRYAKTITLAYRMPASLFPKGLHISYVAYKENPVIAGYTNEGRKPGVVPTGDETLMNVYLHEEALTELWSLSDEAVSTRVIAELSKVFPEIRGKENELALHALKRWERAMPKFTPEHVERVRAFERTHQGDGNIFLAGDYMNAPWTEGAARSGKRVAELITRKLS